LPSGSRPPLRIGGFVPFTSTDYPDALATVIFCQGCPWRCCYCHNPHLIPSHGGDEHDFAQILEWLGSRRGLLDAVVFSGGEPTAQAQLSNAIDAVRSLGFKVGLHTAGSYPRRLAKILSSVDWIGIDVKTAIADYTSVTGIRGSGEQAFSSLVLVRDAGVACEVRTTVHPVLTPPIALLNLAQQLEDRGVTRWVLQMFRATGCGEARVVATAPNGATVEPELLARLRKHVPAIEVRASDAVVQ
jgi:anaerobic ribonucleoside-triphosphate reductase activating protein